MTWKPIVKPVAIGLETTGYAHVVSNGRREITVRHHTHRNWEKVYSIPIGNGYVKCIGKGRRQPDLTPHPEAVSIAELLNGME